MMSTKRGCDSKGRIYTSQGNEIADDGIGSRPKSSSRPYKMQASGSRLMNVSSSNDRRQESKGMGSADLRRSSGRADDRCENSRDTCQPERYCKSELVAPEEFCREPCKPPAKKRVPTLLGDVNCAHPEHVDHVWGSWNFLYKMYKKNVMTDLTLKLENGDTYEIHKVVLASHSDKFAQAIMEASKKNVALELHICNTSEAAILAVIDYLYTFKITLNDDIIDGVLSIANQLHLDTLIPFCCKYLIDNVCPNSAIRLLAIAQKNKLTEPSIYLYNYVLKHFVAVSKSACFMKLDAQSLAAFIGSDDICIDNEFQVFKIAMNWIAHCKDRCQQAFEALRNVRFNLIPIRTLDCEVEPPVDKLNCSECLFLVYKAYKCFAVTYADQIQKGSPKTKRIQSNTTVNTTNCAASPSISFDSLCSDYTNDKGRSTKSRSYSGKAPKCVGPQRMPKVHRQKAGAEKVILNFKSKGIPAEPPARHMSNTPSRLIKKAISVSSGSTCDMGGTLTDPCSVCSVLTDMKEDGPFLYVVGGVDCTNANSTQSGKAVFKYSVRECRWRQAQSLPIKRMGHCIVRHGSYLYCVGGACPNDGLEDTSDILLRYDIPRDQWTRPDILSPMQSPRMYFSACLVCDNYIFAIGGSGESSRILRSTEFYDVSKDCWKVGSDLNKGRVSLASAVYKGKIFAVGGYSSSRTGPIIFSSVEVLDLSGDFASNQWKMYHDLPGPRCYATLNEASGNLYLVGGATQFLDMGDGQETNIGHLSSSASILIYKHKSECWLEVGKLRQPRHDISGAVINDRFIYIFSGINSNEGINPKQLNSVECFDSTCNRINGNKALVMPYFAFGHAVASTH